MAEHLFNSRLIYYETSTNNTMVSFLTYVRYSASTNFTTSWINILQKACFRWKVCGKPCSADTLHKKRNFYLFQESSEKYPFLGSIILRSDGLCGLWTSARYNPELSSLCSKTMRVIGRLTMPAYINICALCNGVNSNIVLHRILFCNVNSNTREQLWNIII